VGARPNFVKLGALSPYLSEHFNHVIVHTGQHYDRPMSDAFFAELEIPTPDFNLGVGSGTKGYQLGEMISRIETVLIKQNPDLILVYGDTISTLAGALAGVNLGTPIAHVEAGLRSGDWKMPEEISRVLTDQMSEILLAPTKRALENLEREEVHGEAYLVGDVMADILRSTHMTPESEAKVLETFNLSPQGYVLLTVHRIANTQKSTLSRIVDAIIQIDKPIIFPLHPRTREALQQHQLYEILSARNNVTLCGPLSYRDTLTLEKAVVVNMTNDIRTNSKGRLMVLLSGPARKIKGNATIETLMPTNRNEAVK